MFISEASFQTAMIPRPRLVAGVRPSNTPFCASELLSTLLQAVIHIATLTTAVKAGKQLELDYPRKSSHHRGFGIKCSDNDNCASAGSLFASLTDSLNSLHSNTDATSRSFWRRSPFEPNYLSNHVFVTSVFQHAVIDMVNHSGRPFSVSFMESRGLCMSVGLSFLLCIVCLAESVPLLNGFLKLAPYPTKASRIQLLRVLLLNISISYFAEYFTTFFVRHDIWRERNKPRASLHNSPFSAADKEEELLSEEHHQNLAIVTLISLAIFCFSGQILF